MASVKTCYSAAGMGEEHWYGSSRWQSFSWQMEGTALRTSEWCSEHSLSLCPVFLLGQCSPVPPPHLPKSMTSLSSSPACFLSLPPGPILLPFICTAPGTPQHWWSSWGNGKIYGLLQPQCFNLTGPRFPGQTHPSPVLHSSHPQCGLLWSECSSASDPTQLTSKATLAGSV